MKNYWFAIDWAFLNLKLGCKVSSKIQKQMYETGKCLWKSLNPYFYINEKCCKQRMEENRNDVKNYSAESEKYEIS